MQNAAPPIFEGQRLAAERRGGVVVARLFNPPAGFMDAAISENILAGVPMRRRSMFQFGPTLAPGPRSHVDSGLGKAMGRGTTSLIAPNMLIRQAVETHVLKSARFYEKP